jgi:hypothetical protein
MQLITIMTRLPSLSFYFKLTSLIVIIKASQTGLVESLPCDM